MTKQSKNNALMILTDSERAKEGQCKCQHCEKWTPNKGADAEFEWLLPNEDRTDVHKTRVVIALCVPCANLYNRLPRIGQSAFREQCKQNTLKSIGGGRRYAANKN